MNKNMNLTMMIIMRIGIKMTKWEKFYDWVMTPKNKKEYYDSEDLKC